MKPQPFTIFAIVAATVLAQVSGQASTACTAALISSFTPCLNYITGSINGGGSPSADCCKAFGSVITSSTDCACLILTGSVPFSLPINRTLAISLPRVCGSTSVPLQCTGTSMPLPSPGLLPAIDSRILHTRRHFRVWPNAYFIIWQELLCHTGLRFLHCVRNLPYSLLFFYPALTRC